MKSKFLGLTFIIAILIFAMNACEHKPKELIKPGNPGNDTTVIITNPTNCDPDTAYFQNTILPIIVTNCNGKGCHNAKDAAKKIVLDNYDNIKLWVTAFKPTKGELIEKITTNDPGDVMPPSGKMDSKTIALIQKWIAQGALDNYCNEGCGDSTKFAYAADLAPIITKNCGGANNTCHFSGSASTLIGTYADLKALGSNQKLMGALNHTSGFQPMPSPTLKLSACDIKKFSKWIDAGYPQ